MSARRKPNKTLSNLVQMQNQVRGSASPIAALSQVRRHVSPDDLQAFVAWLPNVVRKGRGVFSRHQPRTIKDLCRDSVLNAVSFEREVAWAAAVIQQNGATLSAFVEAATNYEKALVGETPAECEGLLDAIERRFGFSLWTIEARLALLQLTRGLEGQKAYASSVFASRQAADNVSFITYYLSHRNEPTTTSIRFIQQLEDLATGWPVSAGLKAYLLFHIANRPPTGPEALAGTLRHETASALVDQYETFVRLGQFAAAYGDAKVKETYSGALRHVVQAVEDERVRRALFLMTDEAGWLAQSILGDLRFDDAAAGEDSSPVRSAAEDSSGQEPLDVALWLNEAEALPALSTQHYSIRNASIAYVRNLRAGNNDATEAVDELMKTGLNYRLQGFSAPLENAVWMELSSDPKLVPPSAVLAFAHGRNLRPSDIRSLPTRSQRSSLKSLLLSACPRSPSLHYELIRADLESDGGAGAPQALSPVALSPEASLDAQIGRAFARGEYKAALSIAQELDARNTPRCDKLATRYIGHCLLMLDRIDEVVRFVAKRGARSFGLTEVLPLEACAERLDQAARRQMAGDLAVAVVLDLASRRSEGRFDDVRDFAFEDFLIAHGLNRASQLDGLTIRFDHMLLVYYLRFVCVPQVMKVSSVFRGTRDLENERMSVLSLLVKLDQDNAKEYETELREITRAQLIFRGVRQVERSKIYVDIAALRKLFEKRHKENFQRLRSLVRINGVAGGPALEEALRDVPLGKPLPQELLEIPKDETSSLLLEMIRWLFQQCTTNPEHGLDCYLSMRIRHGTLFGQLRKPLEAEKIITQKASDTGDYEANSYWPIRLFQLEQDLLAGIDARLAEFSAEYDAFITQISNELIQVQGPDKPKGLFSIVLMSIRFRIWASEISSELSFDAFFDGCVELFWEAVSASLDMVRSVIDEQLKPRVTAMFANLERDIEDLAGSAPTVDLDRAIRTAQTGAHQALDLVKDWFQPPQPTAEPNFPIEDLIDVGLQSVRKIRRDFDPEVDLEVPPLPPFASALTLFSDIFFIIFDNIRQHSGVAGRPQVRIVVEDQGDSLRINACSEIAAWACSEAARAKIGRIKDLIASNGYQQAVTSEGGTGLIKLRKLVGKGEGVPAHLDFGFVESSSFFVEFKLGKREIQL